MHDQLIDAPPLNVSDRNCTVDPPGDGELLFGAKCEPPKLSSLKLVAVAFQLLLRHEYFEYRITRLPTDKRSSK